MKIAIRMLGSVLLIPLLLAGCKTEQSSSSQSSGSSSGPSPSASSSSSGGPSSESGSSSGTSLPSGSSGTGGSASSPAASSPASGSTASAGGFPASGSDTASPGNSTDAGGFPADESGTAGDPADSGQEGSSVDAQGDAGDMAGAASGGGMTADEAVGQLDSQLDASLAVFDGMILTERRAAETIGGGNSDAGSEEGADESDGGGIGDVAGTGGPLFEEADLSEPGLGGEEATVPDMPEGSEGGTNTIAGAGNAPHGNIPPDLVDGSDDDIVARQIREAAMKETDPELQAKLWDEYRKYKKGQ